ncbi:MULTISPECIES: sodium:solute symporter family transporter [Paenibacillus]|uniref:sodium:solute symporter family transporter n=1 Tax=Paenibacillus TaxID=44249 RepID=UPI0022B90E47|nr:sodium:solute symporter [Paenibacillus caseinilyticus]MCZ8521351.1 sodium:solute symporter [Paenibacillus caseinilyticus]
MLQANHIQPYIGYILMAGLGLFMLFIALSVRKSLVRTTHDYIIADRKIGLGFGVGSVIAVWTWAMAVMMSSGQAYSWGLSGLFWFTVPNGIAVMAMVPFALRLRKVIPNGYTITDFIRSRFQNRPALIIAIIGMIFGIFLEIIINLKGAVLLVQTIFGIREIMILAIVIVVVTVYSYFGGIWTSAITATINTLLITVPAAIVALYVLYKVGGPGVVFDSLKKQDPELLSIFRPEAAAGFGVTLALGLLASTVADQTFWQKVWAIKPNYVKRTFIWSGAWFYPIPIALGLIGLVALGIGLKLEDIGGDVTAVGPYLISHLGLPLIIVILYALLVLNACYSTIDGAFSALSSLVAVDIVRPLWPRLSEKKLFAVTKLSIVACAVVAGAIVMSGLNFVSLVLTTYAIKTSLLIPLILAIYWTKLTSKGFLWGIVLSTAIGLPVRIAYDELVGTLVIFGVSAIVPVVWSLLSKEKPFDFNVLKHTNQLNDELAEHAVSNQAGHAYIPKKSAGREV